MKQDEKLEIITILSRNMKEHRQQQHITQEELSFRSGLHRNYISDTERGTRNISLQAIEKIAHGLNIEIEDLFKK
ncbi:DNA-binding XRE family transcriptional regulator [Entomoplasma freundtii]|uniref:Transcriptional regulator n=1 Tax=Entomoplasma freundtii TaxID=74700 RepID=A0A2K8NSD0_9MOLU|nr:helix-turn-helix transcriptional regulator [Entomoplasma freundtii]ATZ16654.1 transcriptional regulator [Entomoplasma freundtii]TDY58179.1 DNA-binding XRE family transcriptional regulator [Entomoplasma freundtii]